MASMKASGGPPNKSGKIGGLTVESGKGGGLTVESGKGGGGGAGGGGTIESILTYLAPSDAKHDFGTDRPSEPAEKIAYNKGLFGVSGNVIDYKEESACLSSIITDYTNINRATNENGVEYDPLAIANPNRDFCFKSEHTITTNGKQFTVKYADVKWTAAMKTNYKKPDGIALVAQMNAEKETKRSAAQKKKEELDKKIKEEKAKIAAANKKGIIEDLKDMINRLRGASKSEEPEDERKEIDAPMFYEMMGLDPNQTIAIIVDAASIGLIEILSTGRFTGVRPTWYYIFGPEVENDPATKKHPSSPEFKNPNKNEGVIFIPCVSLNPSSFVYSYSYIQDDPSNLYLNKFFTNFIFELSELKDVKKGKTIEYTTDLTIKAISDTGEVKFIDESIDSKSKNDINFLTKLITELKTAFSSGEEKKFQYAISFLKKMAGDWLQVLLAVAVESRTRGFTPYAAAVRENVTAKIDRVFFVTHDQIALTFALLMGVECLFTHHAPVEGNPSLHSAFLYSLTSEADVNASINTKAESLIRSYKSYVSQIEASITKIDKYNEQCKTSIFEPTNDLDRHLKDHLRYDIISPFQVDAFDAYVQTIFTSALRIVATKKILPELTQDLVEPFIINDEELSRTIAKYKSVKDPATKILLGKQILELDARISSGIKNADKIIDSAQDFFKAPKGDGVMNITIKIREFTKTLIYVAAQNWTWDSVEVSNRSLSRLQNMGEFQAFNSDRNIFVNHIDALDNESKSKITLLFAKCYKCMIEPSTVFVLNTKKTTKIESRQITLTKTQSIKFKPMATTFCYEIFINFGVNFELKDDRTNPGKITIDEINPGKITIDEINTYCDTIIVANDVISLWGDVLAEEHAEKTTGPTGLNHLSEEILVAQMEDSAKVLDKAIETFDTNEPVETAAAKKAKKQSTVSMYCDSVYTACKLLKTKLLLGRGIGIGGGGGGGIRVGGSSHKLNLKGGGREDCNFHFLLPIYVLLFQLHKTTSNENFKESADFDLVLQYYDFLLRMETKLLELSNDDACKIALGIRDLFFINNVVSDKNKIEETYLPEELRNLPTKMLSLSGLLTTGFCGVLNEDYFTNTDSRFKTIEDSVFTGFINSIDIPGCFKTQFDLVMDQIDYKEFVDAVSQSARKVSKIIIADRATERQESITDTTAGKNYGHDMISKKLPILKPVPAYGGKKTRRKSRRPYKKTRKWRKTTK